MYSGLATTIRAKYLSSPIVHSEFLMEKTSRSPETILAALRKKHTFEHIFGGYDYTETVAEDSRCHGTHCCSLHSNFLICKYATASFGYANALHYMTDVSVGNKVSPGTQKQKEARNPGKINKRTLAGQNEASAPSRLRGKHDISSIAVLVRIRPPPSAIYTPVHPLVSFESPSNNLSRKHGAASAPSMLRSNHEI